MKAFYCCGIPVALVLLVTAGFWLNWQYSKRVNRHLYQYLRARLGSGLRVGELARRLKMEEGQLRKVLVRYQSRQIPKRTGGLRALEVPEPALMEVQRKILRLLLGRLRCHTAVHGFERGRSIVTNANPHAGRPVIVKLDLKDFFRQTSAARVESYFRRIGWSTAAAALLTDLVTYKGGLPQGAPTSPRLSNLVNMQMDSRLTKLATKKRGVYTRYADDMTFSFLRDVPERQRGLVQMVRNRLRHYGYSLNEQKTRILRPHQQKRVTGLVVHAAPRLPRRTRRWLRAVRYNQQHGRQITLSEAQLAGWEALERMIAQQANAPDLPKIRRRRTKKKTPGS